jgi:hypothetical protein
LQKKRTVAVAISLNNDVWARSYRKGCTMPPQENITLQNFTVENEVGILLHSNYPCNGITLADTDLGQCRICFTSEPLDGLTYPTATVTLNNVITNENSLICDEKHQINVKKI